MHTCGNVFRLCLPALTQEAKMLRSIGSHPHKHASYLTEPFGCAAVIGRFVFYAAAALRWMEAEFGELVMSLLRRRRPTGLQTLVH